MSKTYVDSEDQIMSRGNATLSGPSLRGYGIIDSVEGNLMKLSRSWDYLQYSFERWSGPYPFEYSSKT